MATVGLPLTGAGDATAQVATDNIGGEHYQRIKLFDATQGSTVPILAKETTPGATDGGMVVRPIGSTAFSQAVVGQVGLSSGSSAVELTSAGSTRLVGKVDINNPTTSVSLSSQHTITVGNQTTAVDLSSGGSTKLIGQVQATGTTKVDVSSGVVLGAGSSANVIGAVAQGPGSSANFWFAQSIPFSSGNVARTTVNTSVDAAVIAANANRKALVIATLSTAQTVALGLTTAAMTTALANAALYLGPSNQVSFGLQGGLPLYLGPVRGINIGSTAVGGGVSVLEFT